MQPRERKLSRRLDHFTPGLQIVTEDVDAIYLGLGGADAVNFLNQYQQAGGNAHLVGGPDMSETQRELQHAKEQLDLAGKYPGRKAASPH